MEYRQFYHEVAKMVGKVKFDIIESLRDDCYIIIIYRINIKTLLFKELRQKVNFKIYYAQEIM